LAAGNPYPHVVTLALLFKNAGHYGTLELLAWPIDFDYTTFDPGRGVTDLLPVTTILAAALAWVLLGATWVATRAWRQTSRRACVLTVAVAWCVATLVPVLPIVAERTAFLSSIGLAWLVASLAVGAWNAAQHMRTPRTAIATGLVLFVAANAAALVYRAHWWSAAGAISRDTIHELEARLGDIPPDQPVVLLGLPDQVRYAYVFRNAFPFAGRVLGHEAPVRAVLDTAPVGTPADPPAASVDEDVAPVKPLVLYYEDRLLVER
jgi:hypothetical protein